MKKVYRICILGLIAIVLGILLFLKFYLSDSQSSIRSFKQETGILLPSDVELIASYDDMGWFGEGAEVYVWRYHNSLPSGFQKWLALPIASPYTQQLAEMNQNIFKDYLDLSPTCGYYTLRTNGYLWKGDELFAGNKLVVGIADTAENKIYYAIYKR